ncbi:hypothetical protein OGAPHI_005561 [Ogataea philodendri]|uniref:Uncharacterized protein n=1 Tax=Ogataea philodendri TaxID=1378263 RepID=A0A9P8NYZ8_9ASCO|nr:uncharacterized protein OGAPHI_005561 [Ogataea philodendri]KAH3662310.1 hypothetical protein OGAPHI_005561 [Ogataea philodendri]
MLLKREKSKMSNSVVLDSSICSGYLMRTSSDDRLIICRTSSNALSESICRHSSSLPRSFMITRYSLMSWKVRMSLPGEAPSSMLPLISVMNWYNGSLIARETSSISVVLIFKRRVLTCSS